MLRYLLDGLQSTPASWGCALGECSPYVPRTCQTPRSAYNQVDVIGCSPVRGQEERASKQCNSQHLAWHANGAGYMLACTTRGRTSALPPPVPHGLHTRPPTKSEGRASPADPIAPPPGSSRSAENFNRRLHLRTNYLSTGDLCYPFCASISVIVFLSPSGPRLTTATQVPTLL